MFSYFLFLWYDGHMEKGQYVYILECRDSTYYTGYTTDVDKRLKTHNLGKGANIRGLEGLVSLCMLGLVSRSLRL